MGPRNLFLALLGMLVLACNDEKRESRTMEPATPEVRLQQQQDTSAAEEVFLIENKSAGEFKIGAPIPVSLENYSITREQQVRKTEEGPTSETVFTVREGDEEVLKILPAIDINTGESTEDIGELRITSEKYKTAEGIGVNSTLEEFTEAYPQYKIWYTYVSEMYVVEAEDVKAQFLLEEGDYIGKMKVESVLTPLKKENFRKGARIWMVRIIE